MDQEGVYFHCRGPQYGCSDLSSVADRSEDAERHLVKNKEQPGTGKLTGAVDYCRHVSRKHTFSLLSTVPRLQRAPAPGDPCQKDAKKKIAAP